MDELHLEISSLERQSDSDGLETPIFLSPFTGCCLFLAEIYESGYHKASHLWCIFLRLRDRHIWRTSTLIRPSTRGIEARNIPRVMRLAVEHRTIPQVRLSDRHVVFLPEIGLKIVKACLLPIMEAFIPVEE